MKKYIRKKTLLNFLILIISLIWIVLVLSELKTYTLWSQVVVLYEQEKSIFDLLFTNHPHFLRYSLVSHLFSFSDLFNISYNFIFSLEIIFINIMMYYLLNRILNDFFKTDTSYILILLGLFCLSLLMNGRITYGFLGITLLIYSFYKNENKDISNFNFLIFAIISLFLLSVSTGTFMVGILSLFLYILIDFFKNRETKKIFFVGLFFLLISPIILKYVNKNLDYFDGSFYLMLSHGIGKVFYNIEVLFLLLLLLPFLLIFVIILLFKMFSDICYISTIPIITMAVLLGMFGHSTLVVCYPAVLLLIVYFIYKLRRKYG